MAEVQLQKHISLAEFLQSKTECLIVTSIPEQSQIADNRSISVTDETSGNSVAQYWEALVQPHEISRPAQPWENRGERPGLLNPRYLEVENIKIDVHPRKNKLEFAVEILLAGSETEYDIILEGKEDNYISNGSLKKDVKIMNEEEEADFRDTLIKAFKEQTPSNYYG